MQHPDEGTIHAWLDGALSAEESARVEAHVKDCAQCTAAVAEARGFIAASSRILTALDNAPRGVIPVARPAKKRFDPLAWRIAASVLVIAGGTFLVVRSQGTRESVKPMAATVADSENSMAGVAPTVAPQEAQTTVGVPGPRAPSFSATPSADAATAPARPIPNAKMRSDAGRSEHRFSRQVAPGPERRVAGAEKISEEPTTATAGGVATGSAGAAPSTAAASSFVPLRGMAAGTADQSVAAEPLTVIGRPRRIGARVTVYEVAGDTVTLTESTQLALSEVVVTGMSTARVQQQPTAKAAAAPSRQAAAAAADSQQSVPAAVPAPPRVMQNVAPADDPTVVHTISWVDPATGSTLSLSGRMSEARLQQIKLRIEKERAAAKKTP